MKKIIILCVSFSLCFACIVTFLTYNQLIYDVEENPLIRNYYFQIEEFNANLDEEYEIIEINGLNYARQIILDVDNNIAYIYYTPIYINGDDTMTIEILDLPVVVGECRQFSDTRTGKILFKYTNIKFDMMFVFNRLEHCIYVFNCTYVPFSNVGGVVDFASISITNAKAIFNFVISFIKNISCGGVFV